MTPPTLLVDQADDSAVLDAPTEIDLVDEMRLRTWARRNYVPAAERTSDWHPVVLDEMARIDRESLAG